MITHSTNAYVTRKIKSTAPNVMHWTIKPLLVHILYVKHKFYVANVSCSNKPKTKTIHQTIHLKTHLILICYYRAERSRNRVCHLVPNSGTTQRVRHRETSQKPQPYRSQRYDKHGHQHAVDGEHRKHRPHDTCRTLARRENTNEQRKQSGVRQAGLHGARLAAGSERYRAVGHCPTRSQHSPPHTNQHRW